MNECVLWTGATSPNGYGRFGAAYAHRLAWEAERGPIPEGHIVHHVCGTKACVNVEHLRLMLDADHRRHHLDDALGRSLERRRAATHCKRGHAYNAENTHFRKTGYRQCRQCERDRKAAVLAT